MNSEALLQEILTPVHEFCRAMDVNPPAYCYVPLSTDAERIRVMQSRLFNELRAADLFGTWLKTTPELDVKATMAESSITLNILQKIGFFTKFGMRMFHSCQKTMATQ